MKTGLDKLLQQKILKHLQVVQTIKQLWFGILINKLQILLYKAMKM
jgi:hypothetical protein